MKTLHIKMLRCVIIVSMLISNQPTISYADSSSKKYPKVKTKEALDAEQAFYAGHYNKASFIFEALCQKKDRNYALWSNQLGSVYIAEGKYDEAQKAFLNAYYLMNDISGFSELEAEAISLFGAEAKKACKGDPYEKVFNSLYVALLFDRAGDRENALAVIKNGILCDSDVQADLYQSDSAALYLLASRFSLSQGNQSTSKEYFNKAVDAYRMTSPVNIPLVFTEQAQNFLLKDKKEELDKLILDKKGKKKTKYSKKTLKKIEALETEIGKIDDNIKTLQSKRETNNSNINTSVLNSFTDLGNNALLCLELGKGPIKYQIGKYGEYALFNLKPHNIKKIRIFIDDKEMSGDAMLLSHNIFFQATTRGGRRMDSILKGQAQFKQTTADMSMITMRTSQNLMDSINQQARMNPYADYSGAYMAAGVIALVGLAVAITSAAANPTADIRHWSLIPGDIVIVPCSLKVGNHNIKFECFDTNNVLVAESSVKVNIETKEKGDNVIFNRIF